MVTELQEISQTVKDIFAGWEETLIDSCLQKVMGKVYVTDLHNPVSACAVVGCFAFYAGVPDRALVQGKPDGFLLMIPQNEPWAEMIAECFPLAKRTIRYAIRKDTVFDREKLRKLQTLLPEGCTIRKIDGELYEKCLLSPVTRDFVSAFESKEQFLQWGRGMVVLKDGEIAAGASSYSRYLEGIEIEVDTVPQERRKHLATAACACLILACLEEGLYPSWDAQNIASVRLAEKLGYTFSHEYPAFEVE